MRGRADANPALRFALYKIPIWPFESLMTPSVTCPLSPMRERAGVRGADGNPLLRFVCYGFPMRDPYISDCGRIPLFIAQSG